jgi:hypothetical protein
MNISKRELEEAIIDRLTITLGQNSKQLGAWFVLNTDNVLKIIEASYYQDRDKYYMELEGEVKECTPSSYVALVKGKDKREIESKILYPTTLEMLTNLNKKDQALTAIVRVMMDYVINYKRVKAVIKRVCMFAKEPYTKHEKQSLVIVYPFALLPTGNINNKVIKDYKEHYTQLDEFIEWLVAARFASDGKDAFLYFLASSNWGKGLLFSGILKDRLGLVTEIKENSLIKINKSEPVGISPESMLHSWILLINELKNLPDEVKELENTIHLRPLYNDETEANVYAKIFCNASDRNLKAFNSGLSPEYKNRFSFIEHKATITSRPLFNKDKPYYVDSLANYIAKEINKQVESYRKLKEAKATRLADQRLTAFKNRHCISKKYTGEDWQMLADEFKEWLIASNAIHRHHKDNLYIITQPTKKYELFIEESYPKEDKKYYMNKRTEIIKQASADGEGAKVIKHKGNSCKGFLITKDAESKVINADF